MSLMTLKKQYFQLNKIKINEHWLRKLFRQQLFGKILPNIGKVSLIDMHNFNFLLIADS